MEGKAPERHPVWTLLQDLLDCVQVNTKPSLRKAYRLACQAAQQAPSGSLESAYAHAFVASGAADFGRWPEAEAAAERYFELLPQHTRAEMALPWVGFARARARFRTGKKREGLSLIRNFMQIATGEIRERMQLYLVWMLCEVGNPDAALEELPETVTYLSDAYRQAALACVLIARGNLAEAHFAAREALKQTEDSPLYDMNQRTALCLILKKTAKAAGQTIESKLWGSRAAYFRRLTFFDEPPASLPHPGQGGGEWVDRQVTPSGPYPPGHDRMGLVGALS